MTNISKLVWTGVAKESAPGTAAASPTLYIPVDSTWTRKTKYVYAAEERGTRDGNNRRVGTVRMSSGDLKGSLYLNSFPYLLYGFMGTMAAATQPDSVNAATAYQHDLTLADVPPGLTFFKGYDNAGYYFAYSTVNKIKLSFTADGKLLEHASSVESQYGVQVASGSTYNAMNDPVYEDSDPLAGYAPTLTVGGSAATDISTMDIELDQKITLYYSARGNRGFLKADYDERTAKISFTARFDDTTWVAKEENDTREAILIEFDGKNLGGTVTEKFTMNFPIVAYDQVDVDTSGEAILVKAQCTAMPGSSKNSLFTASFINTTAAYTS